MILLQRVWCFPRKLGVPRGHLRGVQRWAKDVYDGDHDDHDHDVDDVHDHDGDDDHDDAYPGSDP